MNILDVYMNGYKVGEYQRDSHGANSFTYDSNWLCPDIFVEQMCSNLQDTKHLKHACANVI
jgi:hypothetical protein